MTFELRDNSFSAFKNKRKEEKTHADLTGTAKINGEEYFINIWKKTDKNGDTYLNGTLRLKQKKNETQPINKKNYLAPDEEEVPF